MKKQRRNATKTTTNRTPRQTRKNNLATRKNSRAKKETTFGWCLALAVHNALQTTPQHEETCGPCAAQALAVNVATTQSSSTPSTCGLVAMTTASHAEGRQFDPGQV
jgi:hypothetical protein